MLHSTSTAPLCFGPWSVPQEAAREQLLAEGAALALPFPSMEPVSSPGAVLCSCFAWLAQVSFPRSGVLGLTLAQPEQSQDRAHVSYPGSEAKACSDLQRGECPRGASSCPRRWGWVLVLAKEQRGVERGASQDMWLQNPCPQLPRFLALLRARTLAFWDRGHLSGWLLG